MKSVLLLISVILFSTGIQSQDEIIKGRYGKNDLRIRAGNGLIEEGRLKKFDIRKSGLNDIAVLYWPNKKYGFKKIGITVFENKQQQNDLDSQLVNSNIAYLRAALEKTDNPKFQLIDRPENTDLFFKKKPIGSKVKILDHADSFLDTLSNQGFDGLFIIYEDKFQDLISGSKGWLPSKGMFKFYKRELVYYGLYSTLIDLEKRKIVKNIGYKQLSADYSKISFKDMKSMNNDNYNILSRELAKRFESNVDEILRVHKITYK